MPVRSSSRPSLVSRFRRALIILLGAFLLLVLAAAGGAVFIFRQSLPQYQGRVTMKGFIAPVSVMRDEHGIPHIFARDMYDAARALGYLHASERMFQMEMQRRAGQGRLAEVVPDMVGIDKFTRTLGLYHIAESSYDAMSPEAHKYFEAYTEGVNGWLDSHRRTLPPEFLLLGVKPEPWKPADSVVWGKLMALQLSHNYKLEMLRAELASKISPQMMQEIFALDPLAPVTALPALTQPSTPIPLLPQPTTPTPDNVTPNNAAPDATTPKPPQKSELRSPFDELGVLTGLGHAASNEWVIAGSRTSSGKPILANDPHLDLAAPVLWYLARIDVPGFWVKGATVPGLPVILLGQNDHIAWGFTTTYSDVEDLFVETIDPKNPAHYLTPGGSEPFTTHTETIHVKDADDIDLAVRTTRHGPVLSDIDNRMAYIAGPGKVMALAFTGLGARDTTSESLMWLNRARNWNDFLASLLLYQGPPQNIVYADTAGHIGFINPGFVPVRKAGDGLTPADGASGAYDWEGRVPFSQLPRLYDPASGFVFNANNAVIGPDAAYAFGSDWDEPFRAQRIQQFFDTTPVFTTDIAASMQADHVSLAARALLPDLLHIAPVNDRAAAALDLLRTWDGTMDKDRPEPLIFEAWLYEMHKLLQEKTGSMLADKGAYDAAAIKLMLSADDAGLCGAGGCAGAIGKALDDALTFISARDGAAMKNWRWGHEHRAILTHKVFSHVPVLSGFSDLSMASSGGSYTLDRGESGDPDARDPFARKQGGGFRGVYDLADPDRSRFMIATGESGHIFSQHYGDLAHLWNDVKYIEITGTRDELAAKGLPELVFVPSP